MASQTFSKAIRASGNVARQSIVSAPRAASRRSITTATLKSASEPLSRRAAITAAARSFNATPMMQQQQKRGLKTIDFAGVKEDVYERSDWPREKLLEYFKN